MSKPISTNAYRYISVALAALVIVLAAALIRTNSSDDKGNSTSGSPNQNEDTGPAEDADNPEASEEYLNSYNGMSENDAVIRAEADNYTVRIIGRDGELFPVTMDYSTSRINFVIEKGVVTQASIG